MNKRPSLFLFAAWTLSVPAAFLTAGFLDQFHPPAAVVLPSAAIHCLIGASIYFLLEKADSLRVSRPLDLPLAAAAFLIAAGFGIGLFATANQFPSLFQAEYFLPRPETGLALFFGVLLTLPLLAWARTSPLIRTFMEKNAAGILLASLFFTIYLIPALIFNQPVFDVDDIFFDSDGLLWRTRFATAEYRDYYWRAVHPFVLLIIRPLVLLASLPLNGDRLHAAFLLTALSGAFCVFLAWDFTKRASGEAIHALLTASLLGTSAAHLIFGSLVETYIFLASVILVFFVLLLRNAPLFSLVLTGLLSFGITISNFAQTVIALALVRRSAFAQWLKYGLLVAALVFPLALLNNLIYPNSQPYFFFPSSLTVEAGNTFSPSAARAMAVLRVMFLHSVVAPDPLILEEEIPFFKVWMFKAEPLKVSEYETGLGTLTAFAWTGFIVYGVFLFLKGLGKRDNRFGFAFLLILFFNFALHLRYGKDLFLYSANWTYALALFLSLAWREVAEKRGFQILLLLFLALLAANNIRLINVMLVVSAWVIQ
ncbi:MAG: hypothetical protein LDL50_00270 [Chloroflexi bacterium]|nr:hypothetical protein [Chloroflexota bacterium]MCA2000350.1 hypothetical protein [Chloroflexota bacterium]